MERPDAVFAEKTQAGKHSDYVLVFGPADVGHHMRDYSTLFENNEFVRDRFIEFAGFVGCSAADLLDLHRSEFPLSLMQRASIALSAGMLGVADQVSLHCGPPAICGGISIGEMLAFVVSGALSVETFLSIILEGRDEPEGDEPEAVGFAFLPSDLDIHASLRGQDVEIAVDYGPVQNGRARVLMLAGMRRDLETIASSGSFPLEVLPSWKSSAAYHTKHRWFVRREIEASLAQATIVSPTCPVLSCLSGTKSITSANEVVSAILRAQTEMMSVPQLLQGIADASVKETIGVGPFLRAAKLPWPNKVRFLDDMSVKELVDSGADLEEIKNEQ